MEEKRRDGGRNDIGGWIKTKEEKDKRRAPVGWGGRGRDREREMVERI
jgi:hypothetical protein